MFVYIRNYNNTNLNNFWFSEQRFNIIQIEAVSRKWVCGILKILPQRKTFCYIQPRFEVTPSKVYSPFVTIHKKSFINRSNFIEFCQNKEPVKFTRSNSQ